MLLNQLPEYSLERYGEYPFLYYQDEPYSNRDVFEAAGRLAGALAERGVGPGDRVVVCMPNAPEVFFAYQAILRLGAIVIPVMFRLTATEIGYILRDSEAKAVITSAAVLPNVVKAAQALEDKPWLLVSNDTRAPDDSGYARLVDLHEAMAQAEPPMAAPDQSEEDVAVILYTSGTTGHPKGVMLTHRNLYSNAKAAADLGEEHEEEAGTTIGVLPLAHIYGFTMANVLFLRGASVVVLPRYDVREVCEAVQRYRVQRFSAVPAMIYSLVSDPAVDEYDLSSLESVGSGSAPLPVSIIEAFKAKFGADIYEGYGLSEAAPTVSAHRRGEPIKPGSVGRAFPGVEVRVVDEAGNSLPTGEAGELVVRGENVTPGYFRNEEATHEAIRDGWLYTGDIARIDEDGYIYIVDRKKDLIIRGGFNIYPRDLEEIIGRHEAVAEAAVIGVPDERMGEEVVAFVTLRPGASVTEAELLAYCQEHLAKYKTPRRIVFLEELPRSGVGKILKKVLREQARDLDLAV